ncbi:MAG: nucleoid-associated protein [Coriobacteriales bacterium]|nr:nucleoid-associated protein [Coriobacteriales bacterium]
MKISHAILHVFDFEAGTCLFSERELDLDDRPTKSFVQRHMRKILSSEQSRHGEFLPQSTTKAAIESYNDHDTDFYDVAYNLTCDLFEALRRGEDLEPYDVLVVDFEEKSAASDSKTGINVAGSYEGGDAADFADAVDVALQNALDAAFEGKTDRYIALVLLPRKLSFVHTVRHVDGVAVNTVTRHDATLPNPSQKVDTYALINLETLAIDYGDKPRTVAGAEVNILQTHVLMCTTHESTKEVVHKVSSIVETVAHEFGANSARVLSRAKAYIRDSASSESFSPTHLGEKVFEDEPQMLESYEEKTRAQSLPDRVGIHKSSAHRMGATHHIKTNTGIDITFPTEFSDNEDYLAFMRQPDGTLTIEIRGVSSLMNK